MKRLIGPACVGAAFLALAVVSAAGDKDKKVNYGIAPMPTKDGSTPQTYGVTDYLMAFKKSGNSDAVKAFYDLYYQPDEVNTFIKACHDHGTLVITDHYTYNFARPFDMKLFRRQCEITRLGIVG